MNTTQDSISSYVMLNIRYYLNSFHMEKYNNDLVWAEANNGWTSENGDEDLWLKQEIRAWDFKLGSQSSQTSTQSMEDLIKYHLSCTVILWAERETFDPVKSIKCV